MVNCIFNADANTGDAFGIFMACVVTLGALAPVNVGISQILLLRSPLWMSP